MSQEKEFYKKHHSSANLIPYIGFITPEFILNKDGSITTLFEFEGKDSDSISDEDKMSNADSIERSIALLGERVTMHWHVLHSVFYGYPSNNVSKNPISAKMAKLYEDDFSKTNQYKNKHILAIVYHAPLGADKFFDKFSFYFNKQKESFLKSLILTIKDVFSFRKAYDFDQRQLDLDKKNFTELLSSFIESTPAIKLKQLSGSNAISYLNQIINPASKPYNVNIPNSLLLDSYLPEDFITVGADKLLFENNGNKKYCAAVSIKDYPTETATWMNDILMKVNGEILISHNFRLLDTPESRSLIENAINFHNDNAISPVKRLLADKLGWEIIPDKDSYEKVVDAETALVKIVGTKRVLCMHSMVIICYGNTVDECDDLAKNVVGILNQMGFKGIREQENLLPSYQGIMPGQWDAQVRRQILSITNLSDLAPINTVKTGNPVNEWLSEQAGSIQEAMGAFRTRFGVPFLMNFHKPGGLGHTLIIGPAGAGKTVFESLLVAMYQKYNPITFIFDKDRSCMIPIMMQGGGYINISSGKVKFNPLKLLGDKNHWSWLASFIETLLTVRGNKLSAEQGKIIWEALETTAAYPEENWRLSSLMLGQELDELLEMWKSGGRYGYLFDNVEDTFDMADMTGIEMGDLINNHPMAAIAFMDYTFYQLQRKFDGTRPGIIDIQEAWFMMKHPIFAPKLDDWLRTMRKRNVVVMMSTQSMQEINDSEFTMSFSDNIPNIIFLPNASAMTHVKVYRSLFQLTNHQIDEIRQATPNKHYYLVTPEYSRMLEVPIKKDLLAYLRADGKALNLFSKHGKSGLPDWRENYLKEITQS